MKQVSSIRFAYLMAFICILALLCFAAYLQMYDGFTPCALCILQRFCMALLGVVFFFGAVTFCVKKWVHLFIGTLAFIVSLSGVLLSGRQAWMQHSPSGLVGNCDVSLSYMLQVMSFVDVMKRVLAGGAECSQVTWQFLHLSLAEWSFFCFTLFALFSLRQLWYILMLNK